MRVRGRPPPFPLAGQRGTERESEVNEILEFCRQMLPVRKEVIWGTVTGAATTTLAIGAAKEAWIDDHFDRGDFAADCAGVLMYQVKF